MITLTHTKEQYLATIKHSAKAEPYLEISRTSMMDLFFENS